ncbi:uncharacterized protein LOC114358000 [Ostrinia furnacalis]|uniref:uncharacterized protein LOC114358000 n=1 Tax=Ostrinia furnacalis TaxID=93504 RepID=UPI0010395A02|nr:uncharacterized protein LOC114358000 [Ostrinia furnacalis]
MPLEEIKKYISISLKLLSLGLIIAAGGFWAGAGVDSRPKYRDEQTLVAGTIWSQILIPIGLLISTIVNEELEHFIHGYFLVTGLILKFSTGIVLITYECLSIVRQRRSIRQVSDTNPRRKRVVRFELVYDKIYLCIGILSLLAGVFTLTDFVILLI